MTLNSQFSNKLLLILFLLVAAFPGFAAASPTDYLTMSSNVTATQNLTNDDGNWYRVEVTVTNTGNTAVDWSAVLNAKLVNLWGANQTTAGGVSTIVGVSSLAAGATAGWGYEAQRPVNTPPPTPAPSTPKSGSASGTVLIAPAGDSFVDNPRSFRLPLWDLLSKAGWNFQYVGSRTEQWPDNGGPIVLPQDQLHHMGYTGITMPGLQEKLVTELAAVKPDHVLLEVGANHWISFQSGSASQITDEMFTLIDAIRTLSPNTFIHLVSPVAISPQIIPPNNIDRDEVRKQVRAELERRLPSHPDYGSKLFYVPVTLGLEDLYDGIHPNEQTGDPKIAQALAGSLLAHPNTGTTPTPAPSPSPAPSPQANAGYSTSGGKIYDGAGQQVQVRGLNMFGFNTDMLMPQYLWQMGWKEQIQQVKDLGFNTIRVPFVPDVLYAATAGWSDPNLNPEFVGKTPLQILDIWLNELDRQGMYFVLDFHSVSKQRLNPTWFTNDGSITYNGQPYTEDNWVHDLKFVAARYANLSRFLGMDLYNEPNGDARWGTGDQNDWKRAAGKAGNEILSANPNLLILVEGLMANWDGKSVDNISMNWGENLQMQAYDPLDIPAGKLVLAPHTYGPDVFMKGSFSDPSYPANLPKDWDTLFGQLSSQHPIVMGEFGGFYGTGPSGYMDKAWQDTFVDYLLGKGINGGFYWCYTPNSGDTGGILADDLSVRQDKMALLHRLWGQ